MDPVGEARRQHREDLSESPATAACVGEEEGSRHTALTPGPDQGGRTGSVLKQEVHRKCVDTGSNRIYCTKRKYTGNIILYIQEVKSELHGRR